MKRLLVILALLFPTSVWAQCNGTFPNNTVCGNITGSANLPRPTNPSAFQGSAGGSNGQIQYNNSGVLGGLTDPQVTARIQAFTSVLSGAVPASGGGTTSWLRADGTFTSIPVVIPTVRVVTAAGAVTVTTADNVVVVNKTVGAATTVNLPVGTSGLTFTIKDGKGDSALNNITITPAAGNIDGSATFILGANYGAVTVTYNGTQWNVL